MRRYFAVLWAGMFCVVCFSLYLMLETVTFTGTSDRVDALGGVGEHNQITTSMHSDCVQESV